MPSREEFLARQKAIEPHIAALRQAVAGKPNVIDVGVGLRVVGGKLTEEVCLVVLVSTKQPPEALAAADLIPAAFKGIPIDVLERPKWEESGGGTRPLVGGIQISPDSDSSSYSYGTLGFFAKRNADNADVLISNEHVLESATHAGKSVYQPKASCCGCNAVGVIQAGGVKTSDGIDCAMATMSVSYKNEVENIGALRGVAEAVVGETVRKNGKRTGLTQGLVTQIFTNEIQVQSDNGSTMFANHGDSGSAIVNADNQIVALLWGIAANGPPHWTVGTRSSVVVSTLEITVPVSTSEQAELVELTSADDPLAPWKEKLKGSVNGRAILQVLEGYYQEVVDLVHHDRATTIAWNANQGPAFIEAYQVAQTDPAAKLPHVVGGVDLKTMLSNMGDVLTKQGSPALGAAIATYRTAVLAVVDDVNSLQDVLDIVNGQAIHAWAVEFFWSLLWNQSTPYYLPTVAKNGLKIPSLGIDIAPFATISTGDLGQITMFKEPVLGYFGASFTNTEVSGVDTARNGALTANDQPDGSVTISVAMGFGELDFSGDYAIEAGGGIAGCAIAGAAKILSGDFDAIVEGPQPWRGLVGDADDRTDLALWYRGPLAESANGRTLLGAYYDHQDEIYDLQQDPAYQQAALRAPPSQSTADAVNSATRYYRDQQLGRLAADAGPAPTVGTLDQYNSGQLPYAYLLALANKKVKSGQDPDGRYAALYNAMIHFIGSVDYVQKTAPGPHPVGGDGGVLDIIAKADPVAVHAHVMARGPVPLIDPETGKQVGLAYPQPLDTAPYHRAYHRKFGAAAGLDDNSVVNGAFTDRNVNIQVNGSLTISGNLADNPTVTVTALTASIGSIDIVLDHGSGWWPGVFDKTMSWLATEFVQGLFKNKIADELGSSPIRSALGDLLTGLLRKV